MQDRTRPLYGPLNCPVDTKDMNYWVSLIGTGWGRNKDNLPAEAKEDDLYRKFKAAQRSILSQEGDPQSLDYAAIQAQVQEAMGESAEVVPCLELRLRNRYFQLAWGRLSTEFWMASGDSHLQLSSATDENGMDSMVLRSTGFEGWLM